MHGTIDTFKCIEIICVVDNQFLILENMEVSQYSNSFLKRKREMYDLEQHNPSCKEQVIVSKMVDIKRCIAPIVRFDF